MQVMGSVTNHKRLINLKQNNIEILFFNIARIFPSCILKLFSLKVRIATRRLPSCSIFLNVKDGTPNKV